MPSTSEPARQLLSALHHQPLLVVLRAEQPRALQARLARLQGLGLRHVEIAWTAHPAWVEQVQALVGQFPRLALGAASVCTGTALEATARAGLAYAVSPVLDAQLLQRARELELALVPGVMTPSEVHRARSLGCPLVKLFPAASVGRAHWARLRQPLGGLPGCIAAGGLTAADVEPWLAAGVDAVALGAGLDQPAAWEDLHSLVQRLTRGCTGPADAAGGRPAPGPPSPPPSARPAAARRGHGGP